MQASFFGGIYLYNVWGYQLKYTYIGLVVRRDIMKKMKRFFVVGMLIGCVFVMAACNKKEETKKDVDLIAQAGAYYAEANYQDAIKTYVEAIKDGAGVEGWRGLLDSIIADNKGYSEELINAYEGLYYTGGFTDEDYSAIAKLYYDMGDYQNQRKWLERYYMANPIDDTIQKLNDIVSYVDEESENVRDIFTGLETYIVADDWRNASLLLIQDDTFDVLFPKLDKGRRRYYKSSDGVVSQMEIGYDDGIRYIDYWVVKGEKITIISYRGGASLKYLTTSVASDEFEGAFTHWSFDSISGSVYCDEGNFTSGMLTGDITTKVSFDNESDLTTLIVDVDSLVMTTYKGTFNEDGTTGERQDEEQPENIIYAYSEDETTVMYVEGTDSAQYVFTHEIFGLPELPDWGISQQ